MTDIALLGHSAVSLQKAESQLVIDPGVLHRGHRSSQDHPSIRARHGPLDEAG